MVAIENESNYQTNDKNTLNRINHETLKIFSTSNDE